MFRVAHFTAILTQNIKFLHPSQLLLSYFDKSLIISFIIIFIQKIYFKNIINYFNLKIYENINLNLPNQFFRIICYQFCYIFSKSKLQPSNLAKDFPSQLIR